MKVIVATLGSAGDLFPYLAVAQKLQMQGHQVQFLSQEPFRALVGKAGIDFSPIVNERDHERTVQHPKLWRPIDGFGVLWRHLCIPALEPAWRLISDAASADSRLTVFASPLVLGARVARETHRFKLVTGVTAPSALRSLDDPQFIGAFRVPAWAPRTLRHAFWSTLDHLKLEPLAKERLHPFRNSLGLPSLKGGTFSEWLLSPDRIVAMFPESFARKASDWPERLQITGFPLYRPAESDAWPQDLERFLSDGAPPVMIFAGSAGTFSIHKIELCLEELQRQNRRAVVVAPAITESQRASAGGAGRLIMDRLPLHRALPRVEAIIHHGGVGTIAESFDARVSQWIWPSAYDQYDNAERVARSGRGRVLHSIRDLISALRESPTLSNAERLPSTEKATSGGHPRAIDAIVESVLSA
jgi:rhamnosyltransferase subunit B